LPLQAVDHEYGRLDEVELRELWRDGVQPPYGAAVIVLPVAEDQLLRESLQSQRVTGQWLRCARHRSSSLLPAVECRPSFVAPRYKRPPELEKPTPDPVRP